MTAGTFSSVFQLACGLDLLLDTPQSIILAMLIGELSSSGSNLMLKTFLSFFWSFALLHMILILIHWHVVIIGASLPAFAAGMWHFILAVASQNY